MTYSIKNFKAISGHDGQGYNATLYKDGKRVAVIYDDGWGGCLDFQEISPHTNVQKDMDIWCKENLPQWKCNDKMIDTDAEIHIDNLINEFENTKQVKKILKKASYFNGDGDLMQFDCAFEPHKAKLKELKPDVTFLNEMPLEKAVAAYTARQLGA